MMMSRLTTTASTGRRKNRSVSFMSPVLGPGVELGRGLDAVVHDHREPVAQLEGAGADHLLPWLHALGDRDEIAALHAQAHELLARHLDRLAVAGLGQARRPRL